MNYWAGQKKNTFNCQSKMSHTYPESRHGQLTSVSHGKKSVSKKRQTDIVLPNQTPPTWYKLEHKHDINVWTEALSTPSAVPMTEAKATRKNVIVKMEFGENSQTIKFLEALILISYYINVSFLAFIFFLFFYVHTSCRSSSVCRASSY